MQNTLNELEQQIVSLQLKALIQKAYEQGVEDGRSKFSAPTIMTRTEAMEFLKCGATTMAELMRRPDFPVIREFGVRIPTHLLMKWIEKHTNWVEQNTKYFDKEAI
ncbi:hypothetical protein [Cytobacillus oceanisediminis]|uniref:hypothetical protein n=1 Tax=Cytobacillus oceanisediminis TaxID=665099 RepID=UPI0009F2D77F|nr:hypothetical protein [Cytobacillus oceanisediminis]